MTYPRIHTLPFLLALAPLAPAFAAEPVEEIIVTARQRAEAASKVPVSLTVLDAQALSGADVDGIGDIALRAPGLVVNDPFGRFNPAPAIRGLTQPGVGEEPSVGFFLDGVYVSGRSSINLFLEDMERVEVLRGPQNALFGRNTFSGAVNIVTVKPGDVVEGFARGAIGSKERRELAGAVSFPIAPGKLSARISAALDDYGGFYANPVAGGPEIGSERSMSGALTLRFTPTQRVESLLRLSRSADDDGQPKGWWLATDCKQRLTAGVPTGAFTQVCGPIPGDVPQMAANADHFGFKRDDWRGSLTVDVDLDWANLRSQTSANIEENEFNRDNDYTAARIARAGQLTQRWDVSQDFRLSSAQGAGPVAWLFGLNLWRFDNETVRRDFDYVENRVRPGGGTVTDERVDSIAGYGSLSYAIVPTLTASADLRVQLDDKRFVTTALPGRRLTGDWTMWTPRLALTWQATGDAMLYASAARGAKSGGFSTFANILDSERSFNPETNWTYEVGTKTRWLDGRVTAEATLFWIDWADQQVVAVSSGPFTNNNFYTANAAASRSKGLELALTAEPVTGLSLRAAYALADAEFRRYVDTDYLNIPAFAPDGDVSGLNLPRYSKHHLVLSGLYEAGMAGGWTGYVGADWLWQSRQYTENSNLSWVPADGKADARIGARTALSNGTLDVGLRVRNVFDDRSPPVAIRFNEPFVVPAAPTSTAFRRAWLVTPADGRTWTVEARWSF